MDFCRCLREYIREYRLHAVRKMVERGISFTEIDEALHYIKVVREYADDTPYPSCLVLGFTIRKRPIHVVFSIDVQMKTAYVITVYEPDKDLWDDQFLRRKT